MKFLHQKIRSTLNFIIESIKKNQKTKKFITLAFFVIVYLVGLRIHPDYGMSVDEQIQHVHGYVAADYIAESILPSIKNLEIFKGIPPYPEYIGSNYGVLFHLPFLLIEKTFYLDANTPAFWKFKHLYTFMWFYVGLIFLYKLIANKYGWEYGLLGCLFMLLSPRIFAHSFFNVKDLVFLSTTIICFYYSFKFFKNHNLINALLLSLSLAVCINVRVVGIMFLFMVLFFTIFDFFKSKEQITKKQYVSLCILPFLTLFLTVLFWPAAWENPIKFLIDTIFLKADFSWQGTVLYMGNFIKAQEVPWHYIPTWLLITTPVMYLLLFMAGFVSTVKIFLNNKIKLYSNNSEKEDVFSLLVFFVPILAVIILNSPLYDGWRHMYFLYVPFILISIKGLKFFYNYFSTLNIRKNISKFLLYMICGFFILGMGNTAFWMFKNHPFQHVYFNILAGSNIENNYERDYWYLSARKGLEYIVNNDDRSHIKIFKPVGFGKHNLVMLSPSDQKRIEWVEIDDADYIVDCFRWVKGNCRKELEIACKEKEVYTLSVDSIKIMAVYDMRAKE